MTVSVVSQGRLFVLAAAVLWSTSGAFVKNFDLPALSVAMFRCLGAGLVLFVLAWVQRIPMRMRSSILFMVFSFAAMNLSYVEAMTRTTAANAIILQSTAPVWILVLGYLFGKRIPYFAHEEKPGVFGNLAALGIAVGALWIVLGESSANAVERSGILLGLASGLAYALVCLSLRWLREEHFLWLTAANHLGAGFLTAGGVLLFTLFSAENNSAMGTSLLAFPDPKTVLLLSVFGVVQLAIPYMFFASGLKKIPAYEAGLIALLEPIFNPILTFLIAGERPSDATLKGGGMMLAMLILRYVPFLRVVPLLIGCVLLLEAPGLSDPQKRMRPGPLPAELNTARKKLSEKGKYLVTFTPSVAEIPLHQLHGWQVSIGNAKGTPVSIVNLEVYGDMPQHGHGLPTQPQVSKKTDDGNFLVEGFRFHMAGWWNVTFAMEGPLGSDKVTFDLLLGPGMRKQTETFP
jgi:DME family drug/metabolite transporter